MTPAHKTEPLRRRTAPRDVRRKQLIMAAMESIAKRGFSDTTLRHVTEEAKLSHGVVNYHFESKEALYDATLGFLAKEHHDLWLKYLEDAGPNPASRLKAMVRADFDTKVCTHKKLAVWFAFWGQAKYRPNYISIHNRYDIERDEEIKRICGELIADGGYEGVQASWAARTIEATVDGHWLSLMLYPAEKTAAECENDCMIALTQMFPRHFTLADTRRPADCETR